MAAPRTVWYKVVKFGTLIKDSPFYTFTNFHVSNFNLATLFTKMEALAYKVFYNQINTLFELNLDSEKQDES